MITDRSAADRARTLVREALGLIIRGTSPDEHVRVRAQSAVRDVAHTLWEAAEEYELDGELKAALFDISNGSEPSLPEPLRSDWETRPEGRLDVHQVSDKDQ